MNTTGAFVLKNDIVLVPCAELSDDMRGRISFDDGDFTLMRRHGRAPAQIIDSESAAFLALFRQPRTIASAVLENSRILGKSPQVRLDELLPHVGVFLECGVLVPAGSEDVEEIRPRYDSGASVAGWRIARCASLIEDSEVYEVRRGGDVAALKIARISTPVMQSLFDNETAILRHLQGSGVAPALTDAGVYEGRSYLIAEWINGVDASVAAAQRRHDRPALIDLCASIAAAYAELHARGVLHDDVHPRNVLAGERVRLVDFGVARFAGMPPRFGRAAVTYFFEPEYAAAARQGIDLPSSPAGEQYAVAALLYLLIAGDHYIDFRYEHDEMLRQVACDPTLPFAARGIAPWPEVESILSRALQKDPSQRHGSMAEMAALLAAVRDDTKRAWLGTPVDAEATALLETTLQSFARGGSMFAARYPAAPTASVNYGCAGAAIGLLRIAETRGDPALLALANVWRSRAAALIGNDGAYYNDEERLEREQLGEVSPYHTEAGIHAAAAMLFAATGDVVSRQGAVSEFLRASSRPCAAIDLTLGRSGSLLAAAMLLALGGDAAETAALRAFGAETMHAIWSELDRRPAVDASPDPPGMAHGWAGYLYAASRWCTVSGDPLPPRFTARLAEHAAMRVLHGRGIVWPRCGALTASWCNGSAGQLFLFTLAHRLFGDDEWLRLAELCAWTTWDEPRILSDLCCGSAGRAYALLNLYKHTGASEWLARARQFANHAAAAAAATAARPNALWKGELGVAVLIADLTSPENARMPFFE
jgi:eukaryotic-like serine/threonine-protein kinase